MFMLIQRKGSFPQLDSKSSGSGLRDIGLAAYGSGLLNLFLPQRSARIAKMRLHPFSNASVWKYLLEMQVDQD